MPSSIPSSPRVGEAWVTGLSIRTRVMVLVLAVLLPALCAGLWVVSLTYRLERESNERLLEETSRALAMVLDRELTQRVVAVRALSNSRLLDTAPDISPSTLRAFDDQARRTLTGLEGWLEVRSAQRILVNTRLPPGGLPAPDDANIATVLSASTLIQPLQQDLRIGVQYATLVQPVLRDGRPVLNLALTVLPQELQRIIDQQHLANGWIAAIIDSSGHVVARYPGAGGYAGRMATPDLISRIAAAEQGVMSSTSLDGEPVTLSFSTSPQGWTYVMGMPRAQFDGIVPPAVLKVGVAMSVLLALAVAAALWVSRSIVRPIRTLKQMALDMRENRPLDRAPTGILECDDVAQAMSQASHRLQHAHTELEHQVAQAVAHTRQVEQRLSHIHRVEALGRLTGGLSHDFNNVLGVISNGAHLVRRKANNPDLDPTIEAMLRAVDTGSRLTRHLLRFAGRSPVSPHVVSLNAVLPDTAELLRTVLGRRIELDIEVQDATPALFIDPHELELSLINLALNARDAIDGSGHVWVRAAPASERDKEGLPEGPHVVISMRDDGSGIDEAVTGRVFEPFFSTKGVHQATGLGLSQVYGFCLQAHGRARIASAPGVGTTVTLVLPAHARGPEDGPAAPSASRQPLMGTRILVVEDNQELLTTTSALLEAYGCEVVCGTSAEDALRLIDQPLGFDAVLTDVLMPGAMDGIALARHLQHKLPQLPVVLVSAHRGDASIPGGVPLVHKPCSPEVLVAALEKAMARQRRTNLEAAGTPYAH
jgi:signal transduction histidine kinase